MRTASILLAMFTGLVGFNAGQQCERTKRATSAVEELYTPPGPTPTPTPPPPGHWMFDKNHRGPLDK